MIYIGIDFSINYPAVCISKDFKDFRWISCVNDSGMTKKLRQTFQDFNSPKLELIFIDSKLKKTDEYYLTQRNKLNNQLDVVKSLIKKVKSYVRDEPVIIGIEGYSYGSAGNSLIDIVQTTGILKSEIYHQLAENSLERMFVFSPSELKNAIGAKGNCGKSEIYQAFIDDPIIPEIKDSALYKYVKEYSDVIFNGKVVKSPISDMIDSLLPILKFKQLVS